MISIITAIYNQRNINEIFWQNLKKNTHNKFELIIIDNGSTDGSGNFFASVGATVIRNDGNYSYPHCQNQGIKVSKYDYLAFLNNDIIVSPDWDLHLIDNMEHNGLEVATVCGVEQVENIRATKKLKRRWTRIKNVLGLLGHSQFMLKLMHKLMYGDYAKFTHQRHMQFHLQIKEGFVGNTVMIKRSALVKIGLWDERLQGADFDLYLRTKKRALEVGDIKPMHICLDTFVHHYIRLTIKAGYPPFKDMANLIRVEDKWTKDDLGFLTLLNK